MENEAIYTLLTGACSGEGTRDVFVVAMTHPENFPLACTSLLLHVDVSEHPPKCQVLLNASTQIDDDEDCSSFECVSRDGGKLFIGNSGGDCIAYAGGTFECLGFDDLKPWPGGVYSSHPVAPGRVLFGAYGGVVIDYQAGKAKLMRIFERDGAFQMHGIGEDFIVAAGTNGCVARFNGTAWAEVDTPVQGRFHGVWCKAVDDIYLAADDLWHWNGADRWVSMKMPPAIDAPRICDVAVYQGQVYAAVGLEGMLRLEGQQLVPVDLGAPAVVGTLCVTNAGLIGLGNWGGGGGWLTPFDGQTWTATELDLSHEHQPGNE